MKLEIKVDHAIKVLEIVLLGLFAGVLFIFGDWVIRAVLR